MKQQRGGTILGLIIGVVIGLAVALVVALYVTKTPVPFLNKGQNRTPDQDAAEEKRNKDWDPNAPLYNKTKPPAAAASTPKAAARPATPAPAVKQPAKADSKPSADPLGDLAKAKAGAADPFAYFIQVGAFRTPEDAEAQRAKLSLTGVEAKVTEREQAGRQIYRVRVGPYDKKEEAEKVKGQIEAAGHETALVRVQR
ncbi:SPOR domain-containing protein [Curvibacter sp. PAE-UM]|uniref:SPOR domain-containing protein n=1 Tax=Curvibacter sp. PAE-UM TaxID=1714344 RepID=UPI00070A81C1|nr:SPOR domain-containing protein [Curvibacter sp. PAE-UM]KRH98742.1 sporulation protein [Curvibacter sp. PAE-UM]